MACLFCGTVTSLRSVNVSESRHVIVIKAWHLACIFIVLGHARKKLIAAKGE